MRASAIALISGIALFATAGANAAPITTDMVIHKSNIVPVVAGCKYGFHPAYYGCAPNRYTHRYRPYTSDYIDEWDTYDYY